MAQATRRQLTLLIAVAGIAAALLAAALIPVPYVILSPGPTLNTLGARPDGKNLIQISGHPTYPTNGKLNLVTVSYQGGPSNSLNLFAALQGWISPHEAVVPQEELFGTNQTQQEVVRQDTQAMVSSQQLAQAAALCQLGIKFDTVDTVNRVKAGLPAAGVLHEGDVITAVDGKAVTCKTPAGTLIKARAPGAPVVLTVDRKGATHEFRLKTANSDGNAVVGVDVLESYRFPFQVKISVGDIGGPSAGLMFALGIIDKLTPGKLTGGRFIAGTGEIAANGAVGPIGGIQQKMAGARAAGATVFLTPAGNCPDTAGAVPQGLRLIKVSTLGGAVHDLNALAAGGSVPSC
ncbi:MAG: PDZ domain-containing protein [Actinobacteria bacterium]|nr:PDZ domain-containing protein [Actinomycetota bacterium]